MKVYSIIALASAALVAADMHPGAIEACGRLGPMIWNPAELPEGVTPDKIRMCADHPAGAGNYWGYGRYLPDWFPRNPLAHFMK